ncbi:hypothetical protein [Streptomyces sp. NPDC003717]|uniref:hypothetical protein n=1 Tax=Streptomyces sp. NPDC003717 TaxID=3154276 RepID=UPI0033BBE0A5
MRRRIAALAATTVIAAGGMLGTATSASATVDPPSGGWDHTWYTTDASHGGRVQVEEYGDIINLCDTKADGKYPEAHILAYDGLGDIRRDFTINAKGGSGVCTVSTASQGGAHDIPEGNTVSVSIWLISGKTNQYTGEYVNDH